MPWLRVDDKFAEHPKILELGSKASRWTWLELLCYCARQGKGGVVPRGIRDVLKDVTPTFLSRCREVGLLDEVDGKLFVHNFEKFNSRDVTGALRQAKYRASRNGEVTAEVTQEVTDEIVTGDGSHAQARARGPTPPLTNSHSHLGVNEPGPDEREQAWTNYAESRADVFAKSAYARKGFDAGGWPPGGMEQRAPYELKCPRCGIPLRSERRLEEHLYNVHDEGVPV